MKRMWPLSVIGGSLMLGACSTADTRKVPPIDAAAPAKIETAVFALG